MLSARPLARLITLTSTLIIPDITKTSPNNFLQIIKKGNFHNVADNFSCFRWKSRGNFSQQMSIILGKVALNSGFWGPHFLPFVRNQFGDARLLGDL